MCKIHRSQNFRAPRLSWYSFGDICRPFLPSHLKNYEFHFFTKLPTKPSSYAVVHRQPWPCEKPTELNFRAPRLSWYSFGDICRPFQPSHLKNHEFHFFTKLPTKPSSYAVVHRQPWPCANPTELNCRAPRLSWLPFGDICRPIQPSHLKNHEFHFFTKLPTKPSSYAVMHRTTWPSAKPTEVKTFVHQNFHGIHLGTFVGLSHPHISKTTNFIFSQNSPPSHLAMPWCTDQLGQVQYPPNSKLSCTKIFMVIISGHL